MRRAGLGWASQLDELAAIVRQVGWHGAWRDTSALCWLGDAPDDDDDDDVSVAVTANGARLAASPLNFTERFETHVEQLAQSSKNQLVPSRRDWGIFYRPYPIGFCRVLQINLRVDRELRSL